ncbi:MAG: tRNA 2-thiouridine(34) synthase MnmA [Candidatus Rifleibacteriota bacterium]
MKDSGEKVLVALSGGVDSSVAAILLQEEGYEVMAVTLKTFCYQGETGPKACCGLEGVNAARSVAAKLGIPHIVLDVSSAFEKEVIEDFVNEYSVGRTPNPCVRCNATVKIPYLLDKAVSYGCKYLATGHYASVVTDPVGRYLLKRGKDGKKDQSYFLWEIPQRVLPFLKLPLGGYTKPEIRKIAESKGLANANRPESQEICFVPDGKYMNFLRDHLPGDHPGFKPGNIIGPDGKKLGRHDGYMGYTVGQRKGIGGGHGERMYVCRIDPEKCQVIVGPREMLMGKKLTVGKINSYVGIPLAGSHFFVQIRYKTKPVECEVSEVDNDTWKICLKEAVYAVSPGQSAVFYDGETLVAGGTILESEA